MSPITHPLTTNLTDWSHIKIGSICKNFFLPSNILQLRSAILFSVDNSLSIIPLAGGSNMLFGNTSNYALISDQKLPSYWKRSQNKIIVSGNYNITRFIMEIARMDFGGFEFLAGIPAHIAGLIKMNAGAYGKQISDFIQSVMIIDNSGDQHLLPVDQIEFDYRHSSIEGYITEIVLIPQNKSEKNILNDIKKIIELRKTKQPLHLPNLGSVFKNPDQYAAGYLLEKAGLKGMRVGDAAFSDLHANFMVNLGQASFNNAKNLIDLAKKRVKNSFNVELELEIEVIN